MPYLDQKDSRNQESLMRMLFFYRISTYYGASGSGIFDDKGVHPLIFFKLAK